jgi:hypothetical protein
MAKSSQKMGVFIPKFCQVMLAQPVVQKGWHFVRGVTPKNPVQNEQVY